MESRQGKGIEVAVVGWFRAWHSQFRGRVSCWEGLHVQGCEAVNLGGFATESFGPERARVGVFGLAGMLRHV